MWVENDEPLYDERVLGQPVRFVWRQEKNGEHVVRAEWLRGENPWEIPTTEGRNSFRHLAIEEAEEKMKALINATLGTGEAAANS